jgi:uncharacterized RDD family membrane protein YckC
MTDYPPPPPGSYPPPPGDQPPQGNYPGMSAYPGTHAALPREAYTPWLRRVGAYLIDTLPVLVLTSINDRAGMTNGHNSCTDGHSAGCNFNFSATGLIVSLACWLLIIAYVLWNYGYRQGTTGSSIGKSVLKFRVVSDKTGQPIGFGNSVVRQLAHIADAAICYIGYLFPLWTAKRQTIADKIVSTVCLPST